jgi:hypothetical protein
MNDETNENYFKNESIFQGWLEFNTPSGKMRAENCGATIKIYLEDETAFIYDTTVRKEGKFTPKNVYRLYNKCDDCYC